MSEPIWIDERDALALHDVIISRFGGEQGLRDAGLLKSALAPHPGPPHKGDGDRARGISAEKTPPLDGEGFGVGWRKKALFLVDHAAAHITGVVRNRPFVDGNKRIGFLVGVLFLELNGFRFTASEENAVQAILNLAAGTLDEVGLVVFLRENVRESSDREFIDDRG